MGVRILTDDRPVMVYRKERDTQNGKWVTYQIGVSSKDRDGNWINGYIDVSFKKDISVNNKSKINIKNAFPTVRKYNNKDGKEVTQITWMIMEFDVVEAGEGPVAPPTPSDDSFVNIPDGIDSELPFN